MNNNFDLLNNNKKFNSNYFVLIRIPILSNLSENNISIIGIYENFDDAKKEFINISEFKYIIKSANLYKNNFDIPQNINLLPEIDKPLVINFLKFKYI